MAPDGAPDLGEDQFAVAATHYSKGRWDLAEQELKSLLHDFPQHSRSLAARFYLAEALSQQRRYREARVSYQDYLAQPGDAPHARRARYRAAEAAFLSGERETAVREFEEFCAADELQDALFARASAYLGKAALADDRHAEARRRFEQALAAEPEGALADDVRLGLSQALQAAGDAADAAEKLQALSSATTNARSDEARYQLGVLHYNEGRFAEAIDSFAAFDDSFHDSPLLAKAMLSRGWAQYRLGSFSEAVESFRAAAESGETASRALYWQGLSLIALEDWPAAVAALAALERRDDDEVDAAEVLFHLAAAEEKSGALVAAAAHYSAIIDDGEAARRRGPAMVALVRIAAQQGEPLIARDRAAEMTTAEVEPLAGEARAIAVRALLAADAHEEAAALLDLAPAPTARDRYLRGTVLRAAGDLQAAREELGAVVQQAPAGPLAEDAEFLLGVVLFELGRWGDALAALNRHAELHPHYREASAREGRRIVAAARLGDSERAAELASALHPGQGAAAVHQAADVRYDAGDFSGASALYRELERIGNKAEAASGASGLAWSARGAGDLDAATTEFRRVLCEYPHSESASESAFALGELASAAGDFDLAASMFSIAQSRPGARRAAAKLAEAIALRRGGRAGEAAALLESLAQEPGDVDAAQILYQRAWCARDLGDEQQAAARFLSLHDQFPDSALWADATLRAANGLRASDPAATEKLLREIVSDGADATLSASALFGLAQLAVADGDWLRVRELSRRLAQKYPDSPIAPRADFWAAEAAYQLNDPVALSELENLGENLDAAVAPLALLRRGQLLARGESYSAALQVVEELIAAWPDYLLRYEADYLQGRCLAALGEFDAARGAFRRVLLSPRGGRTETAAMAQWMVGETHFHQEQYAEAISAYLRVNILFAYPRWKASALLQAGKCAELLEQPSRAAEFYIEGVAAAPDGEYIDELRRRLAGVRTTTARGAALHETIQQ